jgi:hypothetical protein
VPKSIAYTSGTKCSVVMGFSSHREHRDPAVPIHGGTVPGAVHAMVLGDLRKVNFVKIRISMWVECSNVHFQTIAGRGALKEQPSAT